MSTREVGMSKYLNFIEVFGDIAVMSKRQKEPLAKIVYYPHWRQHVLESLGPGSVFNDEYLADIIQKLKSLNENRGKQ